MRKGIDSPQFYSERSAMPIYIYETIPEKEGEEPRRFEVEQRMTDDALTLDPETGLKVKRVITGGAGVIFNGPSIMSMNTGKGKKV
ncbi:MAG: zinc ribbon domain-containing protein [Verrucomicrobiota bacterium]